MATRNRKLNQPPGTLVYTGKKIYEKTEMTLITYSPNTVSKAIIQDISQINHEKGVNWLNVSGLNDIELIKEIGKKYKIDTLTLEDILHIEQRSKLEISKDHLFTVLKMIYLSQAEEIIYEHLSIILIDNMVITFQEEFGDVFDGVRSRIENEKSPMRKKQADYLYYALIDALVDHRTDVVQLIQSRADDLEITILDEEEDALNHLYWVRKQLLKLKSSTASLEAILDELVSEKNTFISDPVKRYFLDVIDHQHHLNETIMLYRELTNSLHEMHISQMDYNMNEVMKTLTVFSAIFIPLSFLAGVFGMNFQHFPGLSSQSGVYIFAAVCIGLAWTMIRYFKRKKWF